MTTTTHTLTDDVIGPVPVTLDDRGEGRPFLLLHGGAGPASVAGFADLLSGSDPVRVLVPVHPGFSATPRPAGLDSIPALARLYVGLLDHLGLQDVVVVGNSIGGWIAAELALQASPRVTRVVLVDAAGLSIDTHPIADFFSLTMDEVVDRSYSSPESFRLDLDAMPEQQKAIMAGNRTALRVYGGTAMADPGLLGRLAAISVPTLVVWGAADRIVPPEHGHAYSDAIPGARFHLIPDAGHLPQLETPSTLRDLITRFVGIGAGLPGR